ncbi:MAG TPA: UV damage endonuclease UvsE [Roseiflexaceae bacterium]|nr:UV damage endonuclease UvsE [Roseiflexaceae bacterium]
MQAQAAGTHTQPKIRLGASSRLLGLAWLSANPAPAAHLSIGLLWLQAVLHYLAARHIRLYRLPDRLAACIAGHDGARLRRELRESEDVLGEIRAMIAGHGLRLSMHLPIELAPGSAGHSHAARIRAAIGTRLTLLDSLCGREGVLVSHIAGAAGDAQTPARFAQQIGGLQAGSAAVLAVENADHGHGLQAALAIHERCGVPVVFDVLHQQVNNPAALPLGQALQSALATWPAGARPKIHIASQRTEAHLVGTAVIPPRIGQHADFVNPFEFIALLPVLAACAPLDALVEAKAGELAVLRLRDDVERFAPHYRSWVSAPAYQAQE